MPGMLNTNVAEFGCGTMIPQGITVAKSYFFITAYDSQGIENSVVYVLSKADKELMTTIILPNKFMQEVLHLMVKTSGSHRPKH